MQQVTANRPGSSFLLYGANGYTGRLITRLSADYGLRPLLAGRNESALRSLAGQYHLEYRALSLEGPELAQALAEYPVVLHAAGPFQHTARPMIEACLQTGTHYLDITGEIAVFEMARQLDGAARKAGIMLLPGTGFDVVPTDCLALFLKGRLPDATHLQLAFASLGGGLSHGTAMTMAEGLGEGGAVREAGRIVRRPLGHKGMWVDFDGRRLFVMTIPWGDISTAYHTTGISNIETYTGIRPRLFQLLKLQGLLNPLLRTAPVRNWIKRRINKGPAGPDEEQLKKGQSLVWGEVRNGAGATSRAMITCPNGYTLTAHSSLQIVQKVLAGHYRAGFQTPAGQYGADLVLDIPGTRRKVLP